MKNHIKIGGKLLQTNKKWSQLKESQKTWIYNAAKCEYDRYLAENGKPLLKAKKKILIEQVYDKIEEREIWIPFNEVSRTLNKYLAKLTRRTDTEKNVNEEK